MKKLSKELNKSYRLLILIFSISFIGLLLFFTVFMKRVSQNNIRSVYSFLNYEMGEFSEESLEVSDVGELFYGALEEAPDVQGLEVVFKYKNKTYPENISKVYQDIFEKKEFSEDIQSFGFYEYDFLYKKFDIENMGQVELLIIKNLASERAILFNIIFISVILIVISTSLALYISKKFQREFVLSLKELQEKTNKIDLNNISHNVITKSDFVEFSNVLISYENMLKRLKEQTDAQIEFVNNASHELKTPIFIIDGYINLIKRWGITDEKISREAINSISEETKNMDSLVKKLLFLAKDNQSTLEISSFSLDEIIQNIINDLKIVYQGQEILFIPQNHIINSDYYLIKQLFFNLIENAIKYGRKNPIEIEINSNKNIIVSIKDRGEGISEENLKRVYDKFFRVDKARSRSMGSHGLGLSIVNKIIDILSIDIEIKSELGVGSNFIVTIPITFTKNK